MKEIKLTQEKVTLVDDEDYEYLNQWKWYAQKTRYTYYANRWNNKSTTDLAMHNIIMNPSNDMEVDHKDHNGLNNQKYNLRICTHQQNHMNSRKIGQFASKFKGITLQTQIRNGKKYFYWQASIRKNNKSYFLGLFHEEIDAAKRYDKAALEMFGEYANLNFK